MHRFWVVTLVAVAVVAAGCGQDEESTPAPNAGSSAVPFDQAFIDAMVPHHREAIAMARAAKRRGLTQPDLIEIADDIIVSQQREIDQMLEWREQWFESRELGPVLPEVLRVRADEMGMAHGGPGDLETAGDVDAAFAQLMIPHHDGAIAMAESAREHARHDEIRRLADAIIEAQQREIGTLRKHASRTHHG